MKNVINERVSITALGFRKNLRVYPRRMEFRGLIYDFIDAGLRLEIRKNGLVEEIFTLSDGVKSYRLRTDNSTGIWTLLSVC